MISSMLAAVIVGLIMVTPAVIVGNWLTEKIKEKSEKKGE